MKQAGAIEKTFRTLEMLARTPLSDQPLKAIAEAVQLPRPTAAHILRKLVALGYAEQSGARSGYRLGPAAWALTRGAPYRRDLVAVAESRMARLARETGETVVLVALQGGRRHRLCTVEGGGTLRVSQEVVTDDNVYRTPTGRLLLAHADTHERETHLALYGLPGAEWPEARTPAGLERELNILRNRKGCLVLSGPEVTGIACPLFEGEHVPAAIGLYLPTSRCPGSRRRELSRRLEAVAKEISVLISRQTPSSKGARS